MSRTKPTEIEKIELRFACRICQAKRGEWCLVRPWRDHPAPYLHSYRYDEAVKLRLLPLR